MRGGKNALAAQMFSSSVKITFYGWRNSVRGTHLAAAASVRLINSTGDDANITPTPQLTRLYAKGAATILIIGAK